MCCCQHNSATRTSVPRGINGTARQLRYRGHRPKNISTSSLEISTSATAEIFVKNDTKNEGKVNTRGEHVENIQIGDIYTKNVTTKSSPVQGTRFDRRLSQQRSNDRAQREKKYVVNRQKKFENKITPTSIVESSKIILGENGNQMNITKVISKNISLPSVTRFIDSRIKTGKSLIRGKPSRNISQISSRSEKVTIQSLTPNENSTSSNSKVSASEITSVIRSSSVSNLTENISNNHTKQSKPRRKYNLWRNRSINRDRNKKQNRNKVRKIHGNDTQNNTSDEFEDVSSILNKTDSMAMEESKLPTLTNDSVIVTNTNSSLPTVTEQKTETTTRRVTLRRNRYLPNRARNISRPSIYMSRKNITRTYKSRNIDDKRPKNITIKIPSNATKSSPLLTKVSTQKNVKLISQRRNQKNKPTLIRATKDTSKIQFEKEVTAVSDSNSPTVKRSKFHKIGRNFVISVPRRTMKTNSQAQQIVQTDVKSLKPSETSSNSSVSIQRWRRRRKKPSKLKNVNDNEERSKLARARNITQTNVNSSESISNSGKQLDSKSRKSRTKQLSPITQLLSTSFIAGTKSPSTGPPQLANAKVATTTAGRVRSYTAGRKVSVEGVNSENIKNDYESEETKKNMTIAKSAKPDQGVLITYNSTIVSDSAIEHANNTNVSFGNVTNSTGNVSSSKWTPISPKKVGTVRDISVPVAEMVAAASSNEIYGLSPKGSSKFHLFVIYFFS